MKKLLGAIFAFLFLPLCANATNIDFNSVNPTGTIQTGDNYNFVTLHDSAIVAMTGGDAQAVWSYDSSTFQMQSGTVSGGIYVWNSSNLTMSGGLIQTLELHGGVAHISGGNISGGSLGIFDSTSMVHIYGKYFDFNFHINGWSITGNWTDNSQFEIFYRGGSPSLPPGSAGSQIVLHTIPEPMIALLLGLGTMMARKKLSK
jgi:hypothetical protein